MYRWEKAACRPRFVETALAVETNKGGLGENGVFPQKGVIRRMQVITTRLCFIDMPLPLKYKIILFQAPIPLTPSPLGEGGGVTPLAIPNDTLQCGLICASKVISLFFATPNPLTESKPYGGKGIVFCRF